MMNPEYAEAIGGRITDLLNENQIAINEAFDTHNGSLKISVSLVLGTREAVNGKVNNAAVSISFDPYPRQKSPDKIKDQIQFEWR